MSLQKLTVADVKASRILPMLGLCVNDPRTLPWLNEGREQLLNRMIGGWWGCTVRMQLCPSSGCLVWPREVADIVAVALCGTPIPIRNGWFEFIENLNHVENCDSCDCGCRCGGLIMHNDETTVPSAFSVLTTGNSIRIYPSDESDVGKTMLIQGYDKNQIWVRSEVGGAVIDGEQVTLALPYVDTTTLWLRGAPLAIQRQATNYVVRMYEHDVTNGGDRLLANYQPDETRPNYRRSILPGLAGSRCAPSRSNCACGDGTTNSTPPLLTVIAKLGYAPVSSDYDWVYPSNLVALKFAMRSRKRDEENDDEGSEADLQRAIRELRKELDGMTGNRQNVYVNINQSASFSKVSAGFW